MSKWTFRSLILLVMLIIGGIFYTVMTLTPLVQIVNELGSHTDTLSGILSGYAFTVAGFLATISTFLFTLHDKPFFQFFKSSKSRSFGTLMFIHLVSLVTLGMVFICSLLIVAYKCLIGLTLALTLTSLFQLLLITFISYNLTHRANSSQSTTH